MTVKMYQELIRMGSVQYISTIQQTCEWVDGRQVIRKTEMFRTELPSMKNPFR